MLLPRLLFSFDFSKLLRITASSLFCGTTVGNYFSTYHCNYVFICVSQSLPLEVSNCLILFCIQECAMKSYLLQGLHDH